MAGSTAITASWATPTTVSRRRSKSSHRIRTRLKKNNWARVCWHIYVIPESNSPPPRPPLRPRLSVQRNLPYGLCLGIRLRRCQLYGIVQHALRSGLSRRILPPSLRWHCRQPFLGRRGLPLRVSSPFQHFVSDRSDLSDGIHYFDHPHVFWLCGGMEHFPAVTGVSELGLPDWTHFWDSSRGI